MQFVTNIDQEWCYQHGLCERRNSLFLILFFRTVLYYPLGEAIMAVGTSKMIIKADGQIYSNVASIGCLILL
jgi:hypothetical protein